MTPRFTKQGEDVKLVAIDADIDISAPLRVTISVYRGEPRFDVRHLWLVDGEQRPTKKGINIPLDEFPKLIDAMLTAYGESTGVVYSLFEHGVEVVSVEEIAEDVFGNAVDKGYIDDSPEADGPEMSGAERVEDAP